MKPQTPTPPMSALESIFRYHVLIDNQNDTVTVKHGDDMVLLTTTTILGHRKLGSIRESPFELIGIGTVDDEPTAFCVYRDGSKAEQSDNDPDAGIGVLS